MGEVKIHKGHASIDQVGLSENASRVVNSGYFSVATGLVFTLSGSSGNLLVSAGHTMRKEDRIRFADGTLIGREFTVLTTPTVNTFTVNHSFETAELPADADTFDHLRPVSAAFDSDGNPLVSLSIGAEKAEDSAASSGDTGSVQLGVRQDTLATDTSADGDYSFIKVNAKGEQWFKDADVLAELILQKAILTTISGLDFSTETTLALLNAKFGSLGQKASSGSAPVVLSTAQEAILTAIQTAGEKYLTPVDFLDAGELTGVTIPKSSDPALVCVAPGGLAANVKKINVVDDVGYKMALYSSATRAGNLICYLPLAGGEVDVSIASGTAIYIGAVKDSDVALGTSGIVINFLG